MRHPRYTQRRRAIRSHATRGTSPHRSGRFFQTFVSARPVQSNVSEDLLQSCLLTQVLTTPDPEHPSLVFVFFDLSDLDPMAGCLLEQELEVTNTTSGSLAQLQR